tara:strand:+ start:398 stop:742 length:345 start_codon:yes stop_codon:yes gene_type:complete
MGKLKMRLIGPSSSSKDGKGPLTQEQIQEQKQQQKLKLKAHIEHIQELKDCRESNKIALNRHLRKRATTRIDAKGILQIRYSSINKLEKKRIRDSYDYMMDKRINKYNLMEDDD